MAVSKIPSIPDRAVLDLVATLWHKRPDTLWHMGPDTLWCDLVAENPSVHGQWVD